MNTVLITHLDTLSNANLYDLLIQGVRDQFLNPKSRIVLRLLDNTDIDRYSDQIILLQRVYHNIVLKDRKRLRRETHHTSHTYKSDDAFDQAMYAQMLDDIIDPATRNNMFVFVEQEVLNQIATIADKRFSKHRHIRRNTKPVKIDNGTKLRRKIEGFRHKKIKYSDITQHPKAKSVSTLYNIPINQLRFDQLRYYFTRTEFQYNPFDRIKQIPVSLEPYDYLAAIKDLGNYHSPGSYYSKLLADENFTRAFDPESRKRIDRLDLEQDMQDFVALSYLKYRPQTYILTLWGPGYTHLSKLVDRLEADGEVYYVREFELNRTTLEGVMFWLYDEFSFEKRVDFIGKKLEYVGATDSNKIGVIVFDNLQNRPIAGQGSKYKTELRNMILNLVKSDPAYDGSNYRGNDLIHVNDYHYQTVEYSQIYFNRNTLKYIGAQDRSLFLQSTNQKSNLIIQSLRSFMYQRMDSRDIDRMIVVGSMALYALGIRRNTDIDSIIVPVKKPDNKFIEMIEHFFMNRKTKFKFADSGIPSSSAWNESWDRKNMEWFSNYSSPPESYTDLCTNPEYYFYFQGIKVTTLEMEVIRKVMRGEIHDMTDLIYLHHKLSDRFDLSSYYTVDNTIEFSEHMKKIHGTHGKDWAIPGRSDNPDKLKGLIDKTLVKRYDPEQIDVIQSTEAFQNLITIKN
jgi:hypothetical protein